MDLPRSRRRLLGRLALGLAALALALPGLAVAAPVARPTLVVAVSVKPKDRAALHTAVASGLARRLSAEVKAGTLAGYRLLVTRYPDAGVWDAMEVLSFRDEASMARWAAADKGAAGLDAPVLALAQGVTTTPAETVRADGAQKPAAKPVFLVVPYLALVSTVEYVKYLDSYTLPQFQGWMREGVLDGYSVALSRYPADRPWASTIFLRYRDDAALGRRDEVVAKVRAELANDPAWKAVSDNKKAVRSEKVAALADQVASGGEAP